ncbi:hypothetical protein [Reinekea sp.]|jgi:hypothetical protein|uniref:hypothetical protein n=1 Tax=Reinekea sp. TaxID=1970455 RepID=UPI002A83752F|nr:hypothetical protein [Reinekea sp.]
MRFFRTTLWLSVWLTLAACGGNTQVIHYQAPDSTVGDWYPIPADAPSSAVLAAPVIPRLVLPVSVDAPSEQDGTLLVSKMTDSLGSSSLRFNRETSTTWELVDIALTELGYTNLDKNRSKYRFVMTGKSQKSGLIAKLFSAKKDELFLLLIPQGAETLVVVEGVGDEIPDLNQSESILTQLHAHFQNQS